ncbi:Formate--tetrahydrofolate ligase 1 [compost metagenome]
MPVIVAINRFAADTEAELAQITALCAELGVKAIVSDAWERGGEGCRELAHEVVALADGSTADAFQLLYPDDMPLEEKIETVVTRIYRGAGVKYRPAAKRALQELERLGVRDLPVCMAKTPYSFTDRPAVLGAPEQFTIEVQDIRWSAGAGFVVVLTGQVVTMPGLPAEPAAWRIRLNEAGHIEGLS